LETSEEERIAQLEEEINSLKSELSRLKASRQVKPGATFSAPEEVMPLFLQAEKNVSSYFAEIDISPENGEILINGERYLLLRSASLSYEFLDIMAEFYANLGVEEAKRVGYNFLFDIGHVIGKKDAKAFHQKMKLNDPISKLSAGPIHFAFTGWANVEILPESNPTPDENFFLKFYHHNSFEARSWLKAKRKSDTPVCIMNCGYSSGWCEESFNIPLTTVEITCEAKGDDKCTFIMAPPDRINNYLGKAQGNSDKEHQIPVFFQRKFVEDKLRTSLEQKETLLKEVHHRVKNNMQIISSLLRLQMNEIEDEQFLEIFRTGLNRVNTMASIRELIYSDPNLLSINIESYFRQVIMSLMQLYEKPGQRIDTRFDFDIKEGRFNPEKAIPLGLILNEIASNAFKHAFKENGILELHLVETNDQYILKIKDNGPGMKVQKGKNSLGLSLIDLLCDQIDAEMVRSSDSTGVGYKISFDK
jgi:two-component sensor histidine kinase/predicted hydrocarbon binding protein